MPQAWVENWNARIREWVELGYQHGMGLNEIRSSYKGKGEAALVPDALPEPYVGDPLLRELDAVMLMLNPGTALADQMWPNGSLVTRVKASSYYGVASSWDFPRETVQWWADRSNWPARILNAHRLARRIVHGGPESLRAWHVVSDCDIVGIDLIPWHSASWGRLEVSNAVLRWAESEVLRPAARIAERSTLSRYAKKLNLPLILAIGSKHAQMLPRLGFRTVQHFDHTSALNGWPHSQSFQPVRRNIRLFVSDAVGLAILQTDAQGGLTAPQLGFDDIIREMLGL